MYPELPICGKAYLWNSYLERKYPIGREMIFEAPPAGFRSMTRALLGVMRLSCREVWAEHAGVVPLC